MKLLLIMLLIASCGKHQQPGVQDYRDSDNDGTVNTFEQGQDKYVSIENAGPKVTGSFTFEVGDKIKETKSFLIDNETDLNEVSKNLLAQNEHSNLFWKYTTTHSILQLKSVSVPSLSDEMYYVSLDLNGDQTKYSSILYIENKTVTNLDRFNEKQTLRLEKKQLKSLLHGDAHLALERVVATPMVTANKTYKVIINDGQIVKTLNVSTEYAFDKLIKKYQINDPKEFNASDLFFKTLSEEKQWWVRDEGDYKVLVMASELDIYKTTLKNYEKTSFKVKRVNGKHAEFNIKKDSEAKVILNIKGEKSVNSFSLSKKSSGSMVAGPVRIKCMQTSRNAKASSVSLDDKALINEINFMANNFMINNEGKVQSNEKEATLEVKFDSKSQDIKISLEDLPASTFVSTGIIMDTCGRPVSNQRTNTENSLTLTIEALVEKI